MVVIHRLIAKSEADHILLARRICESCKNKFLIVDDEPMKPA